MKSTYIQIRISPEEKKGFQDAARLAGIPVSAWVRERLRLAAIRELEGARFPIPFIKRISLKDNDDA